MPFKPAAKTYTKAERCTALTNRRDSDYDGPQAGVAEWYTHTTQNRAGATP